MTKLYSRKQLPGLFAEAKLPPMALSTLHKLHSLGSGPRPDLYVGRIAFYLGDEAIEWRRARLAAQGERSLERQIETLRSRLKQLERMQRLKKAAGCSK